jgi:multidrug efflux pump subunit AcrA (membrane-fusion protein)
VLVPAVLHDVAGDNTGNDHGDDADDVAATLREELATARVTIGRLEERLAAAGEMRAAVEARAAADAAALREALIKAEARGDRLEAALAEARRPWLARVLEGLRRKG